MKVSVLPGGTVTAGQWTWLWNTLPVSLHAGNPVEHRVFGIENDLIHRTGP